MASLQIERYGSYQIQFRFEGRRYKRSLQTKDEAQAQVRKRAIEETIDLLERGRLRIPEGIEPGEFILADGNLDKCEKSATLIHTEQVNNKTAPPLSLSLADFFTEFFNSIPEDNLEDETLGAMHIHENHLLRILNPTFDVTKLKLADLQNYVNKRATEDTQFFAEKPAHGKEPKRTKVSADTIKKELVTLGTAWRWATSVPLVTGSLPRQGLRFPKSVEKPPFQTWEEIERQIQRNDLKGRPADVLWHALYLRRSEIDEVLAHVRTTAIYAFIHPMFVMAAHTGARRSEMLRSCRSDFDFMNNVVTIREKKRVRGKLTTRRVPLSPTLRTVMADWFDNHHPGVANTFCYTGPVVRSRMKSAARSQITSDVCQNTFQRTLSNSKWERIRGWHCFRHSFISNMACEGIDQRIIDGIVGHTSEAMRRRYRHLFPDVKENAIHKVFG